MKTIQQLLELSKNPYYILSADEQEVLNDFLFKKQDTISKVSPKKSSKKSSKKTRVIVRNIVKKVDTYAPEAAETASNEV